MTQHGIAYAAQNVEISVPREDAATDTSGDTPEYHTPLAGEPLQTVFMNRPVNIVAQDRARVTALSLGGAFYTPRQDRFCSQQ